MKLNINKVVFINTKGERYAWYLTIVKIDNKPCCFWSHHKCTGMGDIEASKAFEREHYEEVAELVIQKSKNEFINN